MRGIAHEWQGHADLCCEESWPIQRPAFNASM
jgi:hypothetical protein